MTFDELIPILKNKHFYPCKTITMGKDGEKVAGLWLFCPPILSDMRLSKIREGLPDGFRADWLPNLSEIHITIEKKVAKPKK